MPDQAAFTDFRHDGYESDDERNGAVWNDGFDE